jgi:hypothetical protein
MGEMKCYHYFTRPNNMQFHNLCDTASPPPGLASLLGMGLKFCIESPRPTQRLHESIRRFRRSVRLHFHFREEAENNDDDNVSVSSDPNEDVKYIPSLYLPSTWDPPAKHDRAELALGELDKRLHVLNRALPKHRRHNLAPSQRNVIQELRTRTDLVIHGTDKGLGPSVSERQRYIREILQTHLLNDANYEFLPPETVKAALAKQKDNFLEIYNELGHLLHSEAEETYFKRATSKNHLSQTRVPQIYGIWKVHKKDLKTRPVISSVNSIPEIFSKHIDYWLKKVVGHLLPTYIKDAEHLIRDLNATFPHGLPKGAKLFSVDAVGMYSNIDTDHGIDILTRWLTNYRHELPRSMPVDFILASLSEIMKNNIFQFGDTFWRQKRGCAMGTSSAVNYACLYVGLLEVRRLLPRYKTQLKFFRRFIDDGIGVWLDQPDEPLAWKSFFRCLNNWGSLKWTCDGHVNKLVFLDLEISITPHRTLHYTSYQKPMNLYLYIPPGSAHPSNMLYGLVYGRLRAYRLQNTDTKDFIRMSVLLARRLCSRGYSLSTLLPTFQKATDRILASNPRRVLHRVMTNEPPADNTTSTNPLIFHLLYHPRGITRQQIRQVYNDTVGPLMPTRRLLVAVSRPKNIRDRVCRTQLSDIPNDNPSDYITTGDNTSSPQILPRR